MTALVAPAGDPKCLEAAVFAGADEVYFGLSDFNARKGAANFTIDEVADAIAFCRLYGVKVNIALNTLLYSGEYPAVCDLVKQLESARPPDSYIIQDIGLAQVLSENFPGVSLHASTQMQVCGSYGNALLSKLGITRVVLPREASREDIREFILSGMETEVFIHGAMCVSRSGNCLMSSMIGKRSGNRGECAYPCRMKYNGGYPLSLKDLCLAGQIPALLSMGASALKIEGRMKTPEYVYGVTSVYRRLIDEKRQATPDEIRFLSDLFSRSGFTDGYYTRRTGKTMFGTRTDSDKEKTKILNVPINAAARKIPVKLKVSCEIGKPVAFELSAGKACVSVSGFAPEKAKDAAMGRHEVLSRLSKMGNTPFFVEEAAFSRFEAGFYPVSALNAIRRKGIQLLKNAVIEKNSPVRKIQPPLHITVPQSLPLELVLRFEGDTVHQDILCEADRIEIPIWKTDMWQSLSRYGDRLSLILPGFLFDSSLEKTLHLLRMAKEAGITRLTLPNFTDIPLCEGFRLHGDYALNCLSEETARVLMTLGFSTVCASPEAKAAPWANAEKIVYGRIPLMHTKNCIKKNIAPRAGKNICEDDAVYALHDRMSASFPVFCGYDCGNTVYNSVPLWLLDRGFDGSCILLFTDEDQKRQEEILAAYRGGFPPETGLAFTRGYG